VSQAQQAGPQTKAASTLLAVEAGLARRLFFLGLLCSA
jgi:hypothetical protein